MGLRTYIALRAVYTIVLLVLVVCFSFFIFQVLPFAAMCPGTTFDSCASSLYLPSFPSNSNVTLHAERATVIQLYDFNSSVWNRLWHYVRAMFTFNFGYNAVALNHLETSAKALVGPTRNVS